jgi:hypothetical protein
MSGNYLPLLKQLLKDQRIGTAYYYGCEHLDILDVLLENLPLGCVQAMDISGVLSCESVQAYTSRGVTFWHEGGPRGELFIRDCAWDYPEQFSVIYSASRSRPASRVCFLVGGAMQVLHHEAYQWEEFGNAVVAIQKNPDMALWKKMQDKHLKYCKEKLEAEGKS